MKNIHLFQLFIFIFSFGITFLGVQPSDSHATDFQKFFWGPPSHNDAKPYLNEAKIPHNHKAGVDMWAPEMWAAARNGKPMDVVSGFYEADIVTDQYLDNNVPVLEVGQEFLNLSDTDKKRVIAYMDDVFGVTEYSPSKTMLIYFYRGNRSLGIVTPDGIQLQ